MFIIQFIWLKNVEYMNYLVPIICTLAIISSILNYIINPGIIFSSNRFVDKIYCSSCKMNICFLCDEEHEGHNFISLRKKILNTEERKKFDARKKNK